MYRHLLVPIDATELSIQVVGNAVGMARALSARVTFFHAVADHAGSLHGDLDVLRLTAADHYDYAVSGRTRELLSKAEAAARALGVPCKSLWAVSDRPAQAIIETARAQGCDLIFMASHGHSKLGMALASETVKVLMTAGLPVLVAASGEPEAPARAIAIIRDEHRSLAAALHAWTQLLAAARRSRQVPDASAMRAIVGYLRNFPVALHHPKEEDYLFRKLRERTSLVDAELDELERQHVRDRALVAQLEACVETVAAAGKEEALPLDAIAALEAAVGRYAEFHWDHMGREEAVILPAAQQHLTAQDWESINEAFLRDPHIRLGGETDVQYHHLIARIVQLAEEGSGAS